MKRGRLGPLWWVLFAGLVVGLGIFTTGSIRLGGYVISATLLLVGIARGVLPERASVGASVRSRGTDVVIYVGMAIAVAAITAALKLDLQPA